MAFLEFKNGKTALNKTNLDMLAQVQSSEGTVLNNITLTDDYSMGGKEKIASAEALKKLSEATAGNSEKFNGKNEQEFINEVFTQANPKIFGFSIENDELVMNYVGEEKPDVSIEDGQLIYKY